MKNEVICIQVDGEREFFEILKHNEHVKREIQESARNGYVGIAKALDRLEEGGYLRPFNPEPLIDYRGDDFGLKA